VTTTPRRVLVAEDDPSMRELLARILTEAGHEVVAVADGMAAIARLAEPFALVLTDIRMPGASGTEVLALAKRRWPATPVIVLTAFGSIPGAVDAMRLGAFDYVTKPLPDPETLRRLVARALSSGPLPERIRIVAEDPTMKRVVETVRRVAGRDTTVLLTGESGSGKEVLARLVHDASPRAAGPLVAVNCAAIPETLLESELFGHEKGAFTGAAARHEGKFEQAHGGTLFLDEIAELRPALQAKLLRVLQEKSFERVGGERTIAVDTRLIAATNKTLRDEVARGAFREDLYYRLAVFPVEVPPLRSRPGDILPLAQYFLELLCRGPSRTAPEITPEAQKRLLDYAWPGNVRELQNVMERSLVLTGGGPVTPDALGLPPPGGERALVAAGTLKELERQAIEAALQAEGGNRRRAAKRLGLALRTLQYKLKEYGIS
jgi:two-component system response regulator FlrC